MHSTLCPLSKHVIDGSAQRIFAPVISTMHLHTIKIVINGVFYLRGFRCEHPWIYFDEALLGFPIGEDDEIYIEGHYFYKTDATNLWDSVVDASYPLATANDTKRILSRHYIDGHFSLDNGLYKEAVINFGTVVEALVNRTLSREKLEVLINKDPTSLLDSSIQNKMHNLRNLRNRVHPNQISANGEITREEAENARYELQEIMFHYFKITNPT